MDKREINWRGLSLGLLVIGVFLVYGFRLFDWQIVNGKDARRKADRTSTSTVVMDAARGEILDINGKPLAVNKTGHAVVCTLPYMTNDNAVRNETLYTLIHLLDKRGEVWEDVLPIGLDEAGKYQFLPEMDKEIETLKSKEFLAVNSYATAEECMQHLVERYEVEGYSPQDTRDIASVRYNMAKSGFSVSSPYTFAKEVSADTVGIIKENSQKLPGATAKITTMRQYVGGDKMPHIIGTIGSLNAEEYEERKGFGYAFNDKIGKSGIEQSFEDELRGRAGEKVVETTNLGALASETVRKAPESGHTVYMTIDDRIQHVAEASLAQNVKAAKENGERISRATHSSRNGEDCVGGGVVMMRVKDFSVIAAATYPTYSLTEYANNSNYYSTLVQDEVNKPLINRALNGVYTPGSCVKPCVASAALQEGAITNSTVFNCTHVYNRFAASGFTTTCLGYHGALSLKRALTVSCNIFFFETGYHLGIDNLNLYFKKFGLGTKTGIEINENVGTLASPAYSASKGRNWVPGDVVQASIGQSDNQFTPLQLCTYVSTIANDGVRLRTHLVDKVTDYTRKEVVSQTEAEVMENTGVSKENLQYVKEGMRSVLTNPSGSGYSVFGNYALPMAGKTGTAETPKSDNVAFVGFAPYDNPEVAVAVVLGNGSNGRYSMTVARDMMDAYFYGKYVNASGDLIMP